MKKDIPIVLAISVVIFVSYLITLAPSVAPQGDSGELITVAALLSIAHPPGYPLYTLLGHLFTLLPWGSVAWRVNLFSAVLHTVTAALIYFIVLKVTRDRLAGVASALLLAFSYTFWLYSLVAEVFPLNNLITALIILLAIIVFEGKRSPKNLTYFYLLAFLFGLALSNHHTIVLITPMLLYLLYPSAKKIFLHPPVTVALKRWAFLIASFAAGLTPYVYILIRARVGALAAAWNYPTTLSALIAHVGRADYGTFASVPGHDPALATLGEKGAQLVNYFRFLLDDFGIVAIILALLGLLVIFRQNRRLATALFLGFLFSSIIFLTYANFPINEFTGTALEVIERFYLLPNLFIVIFFGVGLAFLFQNTRRTLVLRYLPVPVIVFIVLTTFLRHFSQVDQSKNYLLRDLGRNVLSGAVPGSLIFPQGDVPTFALLYVRYVENFRSDVEFFTANMTLKTNNYGYLREKRPELDLALPRAATFSGVVTANIQKVPIYAFGPPPNSDGFKIASPSGFLFRLKSNEDLSPFNEWRRETENVLAGYKLPTSSDVATRLTIADSTVLVYYTRMFNILGDICFSGKDYACAKDYYLKALMYYPDDYIVNLSLAKMLETKGDCQKAEVILLGLVVKKQNYNLYNSLMNLAKDCFRDPEKAKFYEQKKTSFGANQKVTLGNF